MNSKFRFNLDGFGVYAKGGGGSSTTQPSPQQEAILKKQLGLANRLDAQGNLQFFPGQINATTNRNVSVGEDAAINQLGGINRNNALSERTFRDLLDPEGGANTATVAPLIRQLQEQILPNISTAAVQGGAFGGDRQALLNTQAGSDIAGRATEAVLRNQTNALSLLPQLNQQQLLPAQVQQQVGQQRTDRAQQNIDARRERFEFNEFAPTDRANRVNSILSGLNFGSVTKQSGGGK
jgi:hypothetical protein